MGNSQMNDKLICNSCVRGLKESTTRTDPGSEGKIFSVIAFLLYFGPTLD